MKLSYERAKVHRNVAHPATDSLDKFQDIAILGPLGSDCVIQGPMEFLDSAAKTDIAP